MSKRDVAIEGRPTIDGRIIEPGALSFPVEVPITTGQDHDLAGVANDFRRDLRGYISCEVQLLSDAAVPENYSPHIEVGAAEFEQKDDLLVLRKGTVRAVHLSDQPWGWSRA